MCLSSCRKYFTSDAWLALEGVIAAIATNPCYFCGRCTNPINDDTENSFLCDSCLIWYHYRCVNIKKQPNSKHCFLSLLLLMIYLRIYACAVSECISYRHLDVCSQKHVDNEIIYKKLSLLHGFMQVLLSLLMKCLIPHYSCTYCYYHRFYRGDIHIF